MNVGLAVVLVAGVAVLARAMARRTGFSLNQRIVLSGIALALMAWEFGFRNGEVSTAGLVLVAVAVVVLGSSVVFLRRHGR